MDTKRDVMHLSESPGTEIYALVVRRLTGSLPNECKIFDSKVYWTYKDAIKAKLKIDHRYARVTIFKGVLYLEEEVNEDV